MAVSFPQQLLTGIPSIDAQHQSLISWSLAVHSMDAVGAGRAMVLRAAQFLISYTKYHFNSEEYAMVVSGYEGTPQHRREHAMMRRELSTLSQSINGKQMSSSETVKSLQNLVQSWIQNHISSADFAFARYCEKETSARSVQLPSPIELLNAGFKVAEIEDVEFVHHAGEVTPAEIKARLKDR